MSSKSKVPNHRKLCIADVRELGLMLVKVANMYPTKFLTERDFFPLVVAYLTGRFPEIVAEVAVSEGKVDFQLKGTNPTWLELAVQPRQFSDRNFPNLSFPGTGKTTLYASQNRSEVRKLVTEPLGKTRFLLLVDLHGGYKLDRLMEGYAAECRKIRKRRPLNVVYVSQSGNTTNKTIRANNA